MDSFDWVNHRSHIAAILEMSVWIIAVKVCSVDRLEQYQSCVSIGSEQFNAHLGIEQVLTLIKRNELLEELSVFHIGQAMFNFLDSFLQVLVRWHKHCGIVLENPTQSTVHTSVLGLA